MEMKKPIICTMIVIFTAVMSVHSVAGTIAYADRGAWLTAIGGSSDFFVDLNGYTRDVSLVGNTLDLGPFSVQSDSGRKIDVPPYTHSDANYGNGTPNLGLFVGDSSQAVTFTFDVPIVSLFSDFWAAGNTSQLQTSLFGVDGSLIDTLTIPGTGLSATVFGFLSDTEISSLKIFNTLNDGFNMDNIEGGYASVSTVPEPSPVFLLATGLLGFMGFRRKTKAVRV